MDDTIFDGEAHALSKDYGYIAKRIYEVMDESSLSEYVDEQLLKYCDYLYTNDKENVIKYLFQVFKEQVFYCSTDENYKLIFRPPHMVSALSQFATLALKFKRAEKDNLENKNEKI
jgi:hypothetical protein